jgi:hypothetical protein
VNLLRNYPIPPSVEFRYFKVFDTTDILGNVYKAGKLNFYFEDGDGNIGIDPPEDNDDDTVNLFLKLYRKSGTQIVLVTDPDDVLKPSDYRIPYMERTGRNPILRGTISVFFLYQNYDPADNDTVRYEFFLKDRTDNVSNTGVTNDIALSYNKIYKTEEE